MLNTEINTPEMAERIEAAARVALDSDLDESRGMRLSVCFEHGQHYVQIHTWDDETGEDDITMYSVIDAEGPQTVDGFDFEEL